MKTEMQIGEWVSVPAFPAFYKAKSSFGQTVLLTSSTKGVVVDIGDSPLGLLFDSADWVRCDSEDHWERLPAGTQIVLTQE